VNLLELQRRMAGALMAPLGRGDAITTTDSEANEIVKPNSRLNSAERLEIYARSYWYRLLDSLWEDFPGLRAIIGVRAFNKLSRAYLAERPSESYTMRNLASRLADWLEAHPEFAGKNLALAHDMVRLEWAHVVAFDGGACPVLGPEDLLELNTDMTFRLQPYVTLLDLRYPVDDLRILLNDLPEGHGGASNAVLRNKERRAVKRHSLRAEEVFVAVHRMDDFVYYKRMEPGEFGLLQALAAGKPVGEAIDTVFADSTQPLNEISGQMEEWFGDWSRNGWFCRPEKAS
jgi:Putative DNA-binding domain